MENRDALLHENLPAAVVKTPVVTYLLIAFTILVYIVEQYLYRRTGSSAIFLWASKFNPFIIQGEYWRFITPIFLHGGFLHLAVNAYSLYAVGPDVEKMFGRVKFILIYLVAGTLGNVASFAFCPSVSVGASGAIFGLLGALLYLGIRYKEVISSSYVTNIVTMTMFNLAYGLAHRGIDNYAHMGGLVGGYLSAFCLGLGKTNKFTIKKGVALLLLVALIAAGIFIGFC